MPNVKLPSLWPLASGLPVPTDAPLAFVTLKKLSFSFAEISSLKTSITFDGALVSLAPAAGSDEISLACAEATVRNARLSASPSTITRPIRRFMGCVSSSHSYYLRRHNAPPGYDFQKEIRASGHGTVRRAPGRA